MFKDTGLHILGNRVFYDILSELWLSGRECAPRGLKVKELVNYQYKLPPRVRFMNFKHRGLNLDYIKQELVWYLRGERYDISIKHLASMWEGLVNNDGSINSNYGYYVFSPEAGINGQSNFERVVKELISDPDSRRAAICILANDHLNSYTRDYPCTSYVNFHIRENKLNIYVRMRSQDAIFGMGNDAPFFSVLHELVYVSLTKTYPELELGNYHHMADSFHVYERHYEMMRKIMVDPSSDVDHHKLCPVMTNSKLITELRSASYSCRHWAGLDETPVLPQLQRPISTQPFTQWLLTRDDNKTLRDVERSYDHQRAQAGA